MPVQAKRNRKVKSHERPKDRAPLHSGRFTKETASAIGKLGGRPPGSGTKVKLTEFTNRFMELIHDGIEAAGGDGGAVAAMAWLFKKHPALYIQMITQLMPNRIDISVDETKTQKLELPTLEEVRAKIIEFGLPVPQAFPVVDFTKTDDGDDADVIDGTTVSDVSGDTRSDDDDDHDGDAALK